MCVRLKKGRLPRCSWHIYHAIVTKERQQQLHRVATVAAGLKARFALKLKHFGNPQFIIFSLI